MGQYGGSRQAGLEGGRKALRPRPSLPPLWPCPRPAVVMAVGGSRFFDVYIPSLGTDVRVHTNNVLRGGEAALAAAWEPQSK